MDGLSELALRFEGANSDLPIAFDGGIRVRLLHDINNGRLSLTLAIGDETKLEHVKRAWPVVEQWKERLTAFQGPWWHGGKGGTLYQLWVVHKKRGKSYAQLAEWLNSTFQEYLATGSREMARELLEELAVKEPETWLSEGGEPFDRDMVRERVRAYDAKFGELWNRLHFSNDE